MTLKLNIINLQRHPSGFDNTESSTLAWADDSMFDDEFHDMFPAKYESLLIDDEPEYDVVEGKNSTSNRMVPRVKNRSITDCHVSR